MYADTTNFEKYRQKRHPSEEARIKTLVEGGSVFDAFKNVSDLNATKLQKNPQDMFKSSSYAGPLLRDTPPVPVEFTPSTEELLESSPLTVQDSLVGPTLEPKNQPFILLQGGAAEHALPASVTQEIFNRGIAA
jgi:hypothetical protein